MSWAAGEFETIDLGDKCLSRRAVLLVEPTASIPAACGG
ncbi:transposase DNA-binding-containing protein [Azotobacter armeniacus]